MGQQNFANAGQETSQINHPSQDSDISHWILTPSFPRAAMEASFWLCGFLLILFLMLKAAIPASSQTPPSPASGAHKSLRRLTVTARRWRTRYRSERQSASGAAATDGLWNRGTGQNFCWQPALGLHWCSSGKKFHIQQTFQCQNVNCRWETLSCALGEASVKPLRM